VVDHERADDRLLGPSAFPLVDLGDIRRVMEFYADRGWTDGLPVMPVTESYLDEFLAQTDRSPDDVVLSMAHLNRTCSVRAAAINAAMAGCRPEYFPVVLAAWEAVQRDRAATGGGWQSTSGPSPMLVVNGPVRQALGFNSTGGVFGPGFRPNMTIPRALGLIVRNALGVVPHGFEQATQGLPGRWQVCLAENEEESPWEPLSVEGGVPAGTDAVSAWLTRTVEFVDNRHTADPEQLLADFADTISRSGAWIFRNAAAGIVFCPEHAQLLAGAGMSKADVRSWLVERCGRSTADLARVGKDGVGDNGVRFAGGNRPDGFDRLLPTDGPEALPIVVAGARNAGISTVVRVFTGWSASSVPVVGRTAPVEVQQ
jgi:hypothetical protein